MRPIIAIVVAVAILGSVKGYMSFQKAASAPTQTRETETQREANYRLKYTTSFAAAADPFQLYPAAIEILCVGEDEPVLRHGDSIAANQTHTANVFIPTGASQLIVEARTVDTEVNGAPSDVTPTVELEILPLDDTATPVATATVTLRRETHRLIGEAEIELP